MTGRLLAFAVVGGRGERMARVPVGPMCVGVGA